MITFNADSIIQLFSGNTVVETDDSAAVTAVNFDFLAKTLTLTITVGTMVSGVFVPSPTELPPMQVVIDLATGSYQTLNTQMFDSGSAQQEIVATLQAMALQLRNSLEQGILATGQVQGTFTPWAS